MKTQVTSIQVLGSGCPNCKRLLELTEQAVNELGLKISVEYVTEIEKMISLGIMSTPALVINGQPVLSGRLPDKEELKKIIQDFLIK